MSLRARIFIITSIVVLLILSVSLFLYVRGKSKTNAPISNDVSLVNTSTAETVLPSGQIATDVPTGLPVKTVTSLEAEKNGVEQLAKTFVERYGSYSTDNDSQNIKESQDLVTRALWTKISASISSPKLNQEFYGITTKVIRAELSNWSDAKALVTLQTARTEDKNGAVVSRYQAVTVEMVKENGIWLANSIVWN